MTHKIKAKAIQMINKQQDERSKAMMNYDDSEYGANSERSTSTLRDQTNAQAWLQKLKAKSEEIFYR